MKIAISIGGSIFDDAKYIKKLSNLLNKISRKNGLFLVVGGGKTAREYIKLCRDFDADESFLDGIGIDVSRINAKVLISSLENVYPNPPKNFDEAIIAGKSYPIVVMGGTHPGHTTDAVTAMLAERIGTKKIIITTDVDGIYTSNPKKDKSAKLIKKISAKELIDLTIKTSLVAGSRSVVDPIASKIIYRSKIPTAVLNGKDLESLKNAVDGKKFRGSMVI